MPKKSIRIKKPRQYKNKSTKKKPPAKKPPAKKDETKEDKKIKSIYQNVNVHVQSGGGGGGSAMPAPSFGNAIPMQFANTAGENTKFQQLIDIVKNLNKPVNEPNRFDFVDLNNRPLRENPRPEQMLTDPVPSQSAEQPNRVPVLFNEPIVNNIPLLDRINIPEAAYRPPIVEAPAIFNAPNTDEISLMYKVLKKNNIEPKDTELNFNDIYENTSRFEGNNPFYKNEKLYDKVKMKLIPDEENPIIEHDFEPVSHSNGNNDEDEPISNYKVPKDNSKTRLRKKKQEIDDYGLHDDYVNTTIIKNNLGIQKSRSTLNNKEADAVLEYLRAHHVKPQK